MSEQIDKLQKLAALARRTHRYCEDGWYSCPKAEDGCYDSRQGDACNCGADDHNAEVDLLIASMDMARIRLALAALEVLENRRKAAEMVREFFRKEVGQDAAWDGLTLDEADVSATVAYFFDEVRRLAREKAEKEGR
jgi:hypothetical protein